MRLSDRMVIHPTRDISLTSSWFGMRVMDGRVLSGQTHIRTAANNKHDQPRMTNTTSGG